MIGVGATIGTGIFFVLSRRCRWPARPWSWSFVDRRVVAGLTAVCYAELASAVPVSGRRTPTPTPPSARWSRWPSRPACCWSTACRPRRWRSGWSQYLNQLLGNLFGVGIPEALSQSPEAGGIVNLPAVVLVALCALLLIRGASESARSTRRWCVIKLAVLVLFVVVGVIGWNSRQLRRLRPVRHRRHHRRGRHRSSSPTSAWTPSPPRARRSRTRGARCRWRSSSRWSSSRRSTSSSPLVAVAAQPAAEFEGQEAGLAAILEKVVGPAGPAPCSRRAPSSRSSASPW